MLVRLITSPTERALKRDCARGALPDRVKLRSSHG